ncbi:MAG TPA: 4Fe-4S dicluster domain-containing protein, partial [Dehalococcoidia bacterium]|nr:4Fe-4S dicluster domain-containing protein [Dehalococcoidia bacterium]
LRQASKVFLVAGIDKIVKTAEDARFQTQCMGIFGLENIVLGIGPRAESGADVVDIEDMDLPLSDSGRELHLIILDNGRSEMLRGKYRELFTCIGCRACNKHCPIRHALMDVDYMWTPKNYLTQFLCGIGRSLDTCLHCQGCHVECPVDINLPHLMWQAKRDFSGEHGISLSHKLLGRPEILARLGTLLAPLANLMMKFRPLRVVMEKVTGIDRRTNLPIFHIDTFRSWYRRHG